MKKIIPTTLILLLGLCFSISATLVLQGCSSDEKTAQETKEENSAEIDYHTCTMHPSVKEKEPGTCQVPSASRLGAWCKCSSRFHFHEHVLHGWFANRLAPFP